MADISKKDLFETALKTNHFDIALGIAKDFRRDFNKDEQRIIQIAVESKKSKSRAEFYKSLQIDIDDIYNQAIELMKDYKFKHEL